MNKSFNDKVGKYFDSSFRYGVILGSKYSSDPKALNYTYTEKVFIPNLADQKIPIDDTVYPGIFEKINGEWIQRLLINNVGTDNINYRCFTFISSHHVLRICYPVTFQFLFIDGDCAIKGNIRMLDNERVLINQNYIELFKLDKYIKVTKDNLQEFNGVLYDLNIEDKIDVMGYGYTSNDKAMKSTLVWYNDEGEI